MDILNNTLEIALKHLANVNIKEIDSLIQPNLAEFSRSDTEHVDKILSGVTSQRTYHYKT